MSAEAVFLRRQAYGPALEALFRAGAADAKNPAHAELLRLILLWVGVRLSWHPMTYPRHQSALTWDYGAVYWTCNNVPVKGIKFLQAVTRLF